MSYYDRLAAHFSRQFRPPAPFCSHHSHAISFPSLHIQPVCVLKAEVSHAGSMEFDLVCFSSIRPLYQTFGSWVHGARLGPGSAVKSEIPSPAPPWREALSRGLQTGLEEGFTDNLSLSFRPSPGHLFLSRAHSPSPGLPKLTVKGPTPQSPFPPSY